MFVFNKLNQEQSVSQQKWENYDQESTETNFDGRKVILLLIKHDKRRFRSNYWRLQNDIKDQG